MGKRENCWTIITPSRKARLAIGIRAIGLKLPGIIALVKPRNLLKSLEYNELSGKIVARAKCYRPVIETLEGGALRGRIT